MKSLKSFGALLLFYGVASIVLDFVNMVPRLMAWIYLWGDTNAWIIKIAFVVVGFALTRVKTQD